MDVIGGGELGAREGGRDERVMREEIDLARQAGGRLKERFVGRRLKERDLRARQAEPMGEIAGEFVAGERGHVMADDDTLPEGLMDGHGEAAPQFRLPEQHETESVLGIHLVIGQEPEILEDIRAQVVGFVDHENRPDAGIGAEP